MRKVERKRMNSEHKKYFLVGSLCIAIFLMLGIGYAVLSQQLEINGTAQITSNWKILFTSAEEKEMNNATTTRKDISGLTTLILDVNLTQPGASATYDVVVENQGDLDAVLSSIDGVSENNNKEPKAIKVSVENIKVGDPLLAGNQKTFQVKVYWDASVDFSETNMQKQIEITLTYEQSDDGVPVGPIPGDIVDMGGQEVEVVTSGDGLYEDQYEDGRYIYRGSNPDNYITFSGEIWRIISVESDGSIKVMRNESIVYKAWDSANNWARPAELNTYLNGEYYEGLDDSIKNYVVSRSWGIGAVTEDNNDLADQINDEKGTTWNGKVGLITASEYLRANTNSEQCGTFMLNNENFSTCKTTDWMYVLLSTGDPLWTISPVPNHSNYVISIGGSGALLGLGDDQISTYKGAVSPVFYLSSDITLSGLGTQSNPFVIG